MYSWSSCFLWTACLAIRREDIAGKNTLSFGHCPNCGGPPAQIAFETYLTANIPQNQYINIIMCFWAPISTSETSEMTS